MSEPAIAIKSVPSIIEVDPKSEPINKTSPIESSATMGKIPEDIWDHSLFDCFTGAWCLDIFCPAILFGRVNYRYRHPEDPELLDYSACCNNACWAYTCVEIAAPGSPAVDCMAMFQRQNIRQALQIRGNGFRDCLSQWCCTPCSLVQQEEQLKSEGATAKLLAQKQNVIEVKKPYEEQHMIYERHPQDTYQQQPQVIVSKSKSKNPQQSQGADLEFGNWEVVY